jgi:transcriptional antiterminator NusG
VTKKQNDFSEVGNPSKPEALEETVGIDVTSSEGESRSESETAEDVADRGSWYVVHSYSGMETKVKKNLEHRVESMKMSDKIFQVIVPTEEQIELKDGERRVIERRVFPGYILVKMILDDESWYGVRNTPGVTGFVGIGNRPTPLSADEVERIMSRIEAEEPSIKVDFKVGERVRVVEGAFAEFHGVVDDIDLYRGKARVLISIFGRETPVEVDFLQLEKS